MRFFFKNLLALFFIMGGLNHFRSPEFYLPIMPDYIPAHEFMVALSGVTEILAGMLLAIPRTAKWGAWFIIAHLMVFFSVHFWMIQEADRYYEEMVGPGKAFESMSERVFLAGLWFRVVMQCVFIVWAYWFTTDPKPKAPAAGAG